MVSEAQLAPQAAYSTFNMGAGFAVYCAADAAETVVSIAAELGLRAHVAGAVVPGPRRVVLRELDVIYESDDLDLKPRG